MIRRAVELLLIAVVLVGGVLAWRTGQERARLGAEYARLAKATGDLTITDPAKIHILALETGEPLHFAWRIYLPPKSKFVLRDSSGSGQTWDQYGDGDEFIARIRIREDPSDGQLRVYHSFAGGSGTQNLGGNRALANFIRGRETEIMVEQVGVGTTAVFDPEHETKLLRLTIPDGLKAKAREMIDPAELERLLPDLFTWEIGPRKSQDQADPSRKLTAMSDPQNQPEVAKNSRGRFQVGLRALFWVTAGIAVWITVFINQRENERLAAKVTSLQSFARELLVENPAEFAVVKLNDLWSDEQRWDVYLPPGKYRVCVATRKIDERGHPVVFKTAPIESGRHRLMMVVQAISSGSRIELTSDGSSLLSIEETNNWAGSGWSSANDFLTSEQRPVDESLELHRRRIHQNDPSGRFVEASGPTEGLLLWIERTAGPDQPKVK